MAQTPTENLSVAIGDGALAPALEAEADPGMVANGAYIIRSWRAGACSGGSRDWDCSAWLKLCPTQNRAVKTALSHPALCVCKQDFPRQPSSYFPPLNACV